MRVYKEITRKDQVIENEICNNCGQSMVVHRDRLGPEIEGLSEVTISGGYFSKHLGDSIEYKFSLCEKLLVFLDEPVQVLHSAKLLLKAFLCPFLFSGNR